MNPSQSPDQLREWWVQRAGEDIDSVMAKVIEYGAGDLEAIGQELAKMHPAGTFSNPIELGLVFYLMGKIARATSAIASGHLPSDDTIKDIKVYGGMLDYARQFGCWGVIHGPSATDDYFARLGQQRALWEDERHMVESSIVSQNGSILMGCSVTKNTDAMGLMRCALAAGHTSVGGFDADKFGHVTVEGVEFCVSA